MKGLTVALIWALLILIVFAVTIEMWVFAVDELIDQTQTTTYTDEVTQLFAQIILVVLTLAVIMGVWLYRRRPEIDYQY